MILRITADERGTVTYSKVEEYQDGSPQGFGEKIRMEPGDEVYISFTDSLGVEEVEVMCPPDERTADIGDKEEP